MNFYSEALVRNPDYAWQEAVRALRSSSLRRDQLFLGFAPDAHYIPRSALDAHCYVVGPSNSGKSSRLLATTADQLIHQGAALQAVDCKGDPLLLGHLRAACEAAGRRLHFFSLQPGVCSDYAIDFFEALQLAPRTPRQKTELLAPSLGLHLAREPFFISQNMNALKEGIERAEQQGKLSFKAIAHHLRSVVLTSGKRYEHAVQALDALEELADVPELNPTRTKGALTIRDFAELVRGGDVCYYHLPVTTGLKRTSAAVANLLLKLSVTVSQDLALGGSRTSRLYFLIDEFQDVAGTADLGDLLGQVRGVGGGISLILANQVTDQLADRGTLSLLMNAGVVVLMGPRAHAREVQEWSGERVQWLRSHRRTYAGLNPSWDVSDQQTIQPVLDIDTIQQVHALDGFGIGIVNGGPPTPLFFPHHVSKGEADARARRAFRSEGRDGASTLRDSRTPPAKNQGGGRAQGRRVKARPRQQGTANGTNARRRTTTKQERQQQLGGRLETLFAAIAKRTLMAP